MTARVIGAWSRESVGQTPVGTQAVFHQLMKFCVLVLLAHTALLIAFPSYGELKFGGSPNLAPTRLTRLLLLALVIMVLLVKPWRMSLVQQDNKGSRWNFWLVIAFWTWTLPLVMFNAENLAYTVSVLKNSVIPIWIIFWITAAVIRKESDVEWMLRGLAVASLLMLVVVGLEWGLQRNVFAGLLQVENMSTAIAFLEESRDGRYRAKGTFQHPLVLAHFGVALGTLFIARGLFHKRPWWNGLPWLVIGIATFAAMGLARSRSGLVLGALMLGMLLGIRYLMWLRSLRNGLLAAVMGVQVLWVIWAGIIGWLWIQSLLMGRTADEQSSTLWRMITLFNSFEGILASPLIGHGVGRGVIEGGVAWAGGYQHTVDNMFLLMSLDNGLPAALLLMACFLLTTWRMLPRWHEFKPGNDIGLRMGLFMGFLSSFFMYNIYALQDLFELFFILMAASLCIPGRFANQLAVSKG